MRSRSSRTRPTPASGVFSAAGLFHLPPPPPGSAASTFRIATWNSRALLQAGGDKAILKRKYVLSLRPLSTVIALQE
eukprot:3512530-Pyramimonas_sp.AAC.1